MQFQVGVLVTGMAQGIVAVHGMTGGAQSVASGALTVARRFDRLAAEASGALTMASGAC